MLTEVEVANLALDEIGRRELATMADTTPTGDLVRRHFDAAKNRVLAEPTFWEFDTTVQMNPVPDGTYDGTTGTHRYRYDLSNFVRIRGIWDSDRYNISDYRLEQTFLYTDSSPIYLTYVPQGVTSFPEYIGTAIAYLLASKMAKKGEGGTDRADLYKIFKQELSTAKKISRSQQAPAYYGLSGPYSTLNVRHGGYNPEDYPPGRYSRS